MADTARDIATPADSALHPLPRATQLVLRGGAHAITQASSALGLELPQTPCRSQVKSDLAALWLGPDEYLLHSATTDATTLQATLAAAITAPHSLVDVSHRNTTLELTGPLATRMLNAGCPLDLDEAAFPITMCTRTLLARAEIVLWRTDTERFIILAWRSFLPYVTAFLTEARTRL